MGSQRQMVLPQFLTNPTEGRWSTGAQAMAGEPDHPDDALAYRGMAVPQLLADSGAAGRGGQSAVCCCPAQGMHWFHVPVLLHHEDSVPLVTSTRQGQAYSWPCCGQAWCSEHEQMGPLAWPLLVPGSSSPEASTRPLYGPVGQVPASQASLEPTAHPVVPRLVFGGSLPFLGPQMGLCLEAWLRALQHTQGEHPCVTVRQH